jgi:hypothetical protein
LRVLAFLISEEDAGTDGHEYLIQAKNTKIIWQILGIKQVRFD